MNKILVVVQFLIWLLPCQFAGHKLFAQGTWETLATLQNPPSIPAMSAALGKIYILSGRQGGEAVPTYEYDPATDTWTEKEGIPNNCFWSSAVTVADSIYVMGGGSPYPGTTYNYIYDPAADKWHQGAALLTPRMYHSVAVAHGKIYLLGGQNGDGTSEWYFDEFDPATNTWQRMAKLPHNGAWYSGAAGLGDYVYRIAGGGYSASLIRDHFDIYDTKTNTWTEKKPFHRGLHAPATVVLDDKIYVMGGQSDYLYMDSVWMYDPATEKWSDAGFLLPEPRSYHRAAVVGSCIYIYGGKNSDSSLDGSLKRYCPTSSVAVDCKNKTNLAYPNPCSGVVNIKLNTGAKRLVTVRMLNVQGREMENIHWDNIRLNEVRIHLPQEIPSGVYIVEIAETDGKVSRVPVMIR